MSCSASEELVVKVQLLELDARVEGREVPPFIANVYPAERDCHERWSHVVP